MNGTEEDSFGFPEFLEKENCLPASNSSTTSSVFGSLNSVHLLQSTSQQSAEKIQKPEFLKCSHYLHNSGGRAISPIIEAFREDMDNKDRTSDKIVQNLVTRFENLFDYFERKQHQLNANWENFHKEMAKFNQQKIHEWAKIEDIRFGLQRDEYNAKAERESTRVKELELELIHAKIKKLEGEVKVLGKAFKGDNEGINDYSEILDNTEQENSYSQFVDQPVNLFNSLTPLAFNDMEISSLNQKFELPSEMVNTMYILTERGKEFTFKNENEEIIVVELSGCGHQYCLLYEYPNKLFGENDHLNESKYKYFRWTTVPRLPLSHSNLQIQKIEINFLQGNRYYKIITPNANIINFYLSGGLEICWRNGDETVIKPDGERTEFFGQKKIEIYLPSGIAYRKCDANEWYKEEFFPNKAKMSVRGDGSYSTLYNQPQRIHMENTSKYYDYLQINAPDFKLRRFNTTKAVKIEIPVESFPGESVEFWLCVDNPLVIEHVRMEKGICGQKELGKYLCFSDGNCGHI
uniref:Uncharacterized protein n=1 Tax=Meloidogyne enterolobii TaxID=390850 RepID=A0A6V7UKN8_MELEN|nr:unnamed protein product [Meloidogyne enterolobii]